MTLFKRITNKISRYFRHRPVLKKARNNTEKLISISQPKNILILCYGNIYRSPFVADYLTKNITNKEISIRSAGTYQKSGRSSPDSHIIMSRKFGVELSHHRSTIADRALLDWADWIVIMDIRNWDELEIYGDLIRKKIVWLGTFYGKKHIEIQDPYGKSESEIECILKQLKICSDKLLHTVSY